MGIGKMKQKQKSNKKAKAKRRAQQNTIAMEDDLPDVPVDAQDAAAMAEGGGEKALTGRQKHQLKVDAKRRVREMLAYKQNERVRFAKKSTDAEPRAMRKALCAEIAMLKEQIPQAMHRSKVRRPASPPHLRPPTCQPADLPTSRPADLPSSRPAHQHPPTHRRPQLPLSHYRWRRRTKCRRTPNRPPLSTWTGHHGRVRRPQTKTR